MNEVHRPNVIRPDSFLAILPEFRLDPTLRRLVPELKAQLLVNPPRLLHVDRSALPAQQ